MSNDLTTFIHEGDLTPVGKTEIILKNVTNAAYYIEAELQRLYESDLDALRQAKLVTEDGSMVSGIKALANVTRYLHGIGKDSVTMCENIYFKCRLLERQARRGV